MPPMSCEKLPLVICMTKPEVMFVDTPPAGLSGNRSATKAIFAGPSRLWDLFRPPLRDEEILWVGA